MSVQTPPGSIMPPPEVTRIPPLRNGDRLTFAEFFRRYETMPDVHNAELIEGVVYMPSPVTAEDHGEPHFRIITWLGNYSWSTPGVVGGDNSTVELDADNGPQPDGYLRLLPECGGQARVEQKYLIGSPELIAEVSASTVSRDLHGKYNAYERNGVREYIVWRVEDAAVDWFILHDGKYQRLSLAADGVYRSEAFPGLWLDPEALNCGDMVRLAQVAQQGLASPEHVRFVAELRRRQSSR